MSNYKKTIKDFAICTVVLFAIFILLKGIVYFLPEDRIKNNVRASATQFMAEGTYPCTYSAPEYNLYSQRLDNYSDANTLNVIYHMNEHSLFESIAGDYMRNGVGANPVEIMYNLNDTSEAGYSSYARQWFGSIVWIRFLFVFFDIQKIRILNQYLFFILLAIATVLLSKKINSTVAIVFASVMAMISMDVVAASMNLNGSFFVLLFAIIAMCKFYPNKITKYMLMFIVGAVTAYIDLFSLPFVTFVMALFILIMDYENKEINNFKEGLIELIKLGIAWLCGYVILWMMKWAFASVVLGTNIFKDAIIEMKMQSVSKDTITWGPDSTWGYITESIKLCFTNMFPINFVIMLQQSIGKVPVLILVLLVVGALVAFWLKNRKAFKDLWFSALLIMLACFPYVCYIVMHTHTFIHFWMWFRMQIITWLSLILAYRYAIRTKEESLKE